MPWHYWLKQKLKITLSDRSMWCNEIQQLSPISWWIMTNIKNDGCSWIVRIDIDIVSSVSCLTRSKTSVHNWHLSGKVKVTTYREEMSSCEGKEIFHHDTFFDSTTPYKKNVTIWSRYCNGTENIIKNSKIQTSIMQPTKKLL